MAYRVCPRRGHTTYWLGDRQEALDLAKKRQGRVYNEKTGELIAWPVWVTKYNSYHDPDSKPRHARYAGLMEVEGRR